jgi:EcsC protein family
MIAGNETYDKSVQIEMKKWQQQMLRKPSLFNRMSKGMQTKINTWIPEKIHSAITATIRQLIKGVLFGAKLTTAKPLSNASLQEREFAVEKKNRNL